MAVSAFYISAVTAAGEFETLCVVRRHARTLADQLSLSSANAFHDVKPGRGAETAALHGPTHFVGKQKGQSFELFDDKKLFVQSGRLGSIGVALLYLDLSGARGHNATAALLSKGFSAG